MTAILLGALQFTIRHAAEKNAASVRVVVYQENYRTTPDTPLRSVRTMLDHTDVLPSIFNLRRDFGHDAYTASCLGQLLYGHPVFEISSIFEDGERRWFTFEIEMG